MKDPNHTHTWSQNKRGTGETCPCGARHPCPGRDCGHLDCVRDREVTVCAYCRKAIEGAREACSKDVVSTSSLPFVMTSLARGGTKAAHPACADGENRKLAAAEAKRAAIAGGSVPAEGPSEEG